MPRRIERVEPKDPIAIQATNSGTSQMAAGEVTESSDPLAEAIRRSIRDEIVRVLESNPRPRKKSGWIGTFWSVVLFVDVVLALIIFLDTSEGANLSSLKENLGFLLSVLTLCFPQIRERLDDFAGHRVARTLAAMVVAPLAAAAFSVIFFEVEVQPPGTAVKISGRTIPSGADNRHVRVALPLRSSYDVNLSVPRNPDGEKGAAQERNFKFGLLDVGQLRREKPLWSILVPVTLEWESPDPPDTVVIEKVNEPRKLDRDFLQRVDEYNLSTLSDTRLKMQWPGNSAPTVYLPIGTYDLSIHKAGLPDLPYTGMIVAPSTRLQLPSFPTTKAPRG